MLARPTGAKPKRSLRLRFEPATSSNWKALTGLFGQRGACGGCWCMLWRMSRSDFERRKGSSNRSALKRLVDGAEPPGLLAFHGDRAIAWCAFAPRTDYSALARSRILAPVDDEEVWSISCIFVDKEYRRQGVSVRLLDAVSKHARRRGARVLEAYAVEPKQDPMPDVFAFHGLASAYSQAGFTEVARRSATRPIMRRRLR